MHMYGEPLEPLLVGVPLNISGITHENTKHKVHILVSSRELEPPENPDFFQYLV